MDRTRIRPRFFLDLPCRPGRALGLVRQKVAAAGGAYVGQFFPGHAILSLPPSRQHFWSPQLTLDFERADGGTRVQGTFGPRPAVWTMLVFFYAFIGFAGLMGVIVGFSQWNLGAAAPALWAAPLALGLAGVVYGTAWVGQRLGREQMEELRAFLESALIESFLEGA